ncbi:MAG: UbiA family prenyltransferase [Crenarchaeota archaeon]|nr:UbiA family prenyltransferase [Thermoproteota archaeon]
MLSKIVYNLSTSRFILYYRNSRILEWRAYIGMAVLGFISGPTFIATLVPLEVFKFMLTIGFYLAFSFSINNSFDARSDALQKEKAEKNPVATGGIGFKEGVVLSSCLAATGLLLTHFWFKSCFPLYLLLVALSLAYSASPFRLKFVPLIDLVSHGLFFGVLLYFYGVSASGSTTFQILLIGVSIFIYSAVLELRNHLNDFQVDLSSGTRTTACWLGYEKSLTLLKVFLTFHWLFLSAISVSIHPHIVFLNLFFTVLFASTGLRRVLSDRYLRLANISTCIIYVLLLLKEPGMTPFQFGGNS